MNATPESLNRLFGIDVQYKVPLYQRRYVWEKSDWSVLWNDILKQEKIDSFKNAKHFTGPIVTRLIKGQQKRFEVIDGQQRLITFQIIFCVIRDLCEPLEFSGSETEKTAKKHIENRETARRDFQSRDPDYEDPNKRLPDPTYKLRTSEYDQTTFDAIIEKLYGKKINETLKENDKCLEENIFKEARSQQFGEETVSDNILDAYDYFYKKIRNYIEKGTEGKPEKEKKIFNLIETIKSNFELVQITPGDSQQAEKIFESVNATGRKLSEFDYLRNNLFLRAADESDEFYRDYWIFEDDPDYKWKDDRLESFFRAFLMARLGPNALNNDVKLFDMYRDFVIPGRSLKEEFEDIKKYAKTYKKLDIDPDFGSRMQFYKDLGTFYTDEDEESEESYNPVKQLEYNYYITVIRSFIMYLQVELDKSKGEILSVFEILESYVARSLLVDTVAGYHVYQAIRAFFSRLFLKEERFTIENMVDYLADRSKRKWVSDTVIQNWFSGKEYHNLYGWLELAHRFSLRYIFYRIENSERELIGEKGLNFTKEEFPIDRNFVRTLVQLSHSQKGWSFGNLTFCWTDNHRQKSDTFDDKKLFLQEGRNGTLQLNRGICKESEWGPKQIETREEKLLSAFHLIWKDKNQLIGREVWKDIGTICSVGSETEGFVVGIDEKGMRVELESGIEGTVDVSEIAWNHNNILIPSERFKQGDSVTLKVLEILEAEQKISLSIKRTQPNPWEGIKTQYPVGSEVQGTIVKINKSSAILQLEDGVEGVIKLAEMGWFNKPNIRPSEIVKKGEKVSVKIVGISEEKGEISLSIKQTQSNPWTQRPKKYKVGSIVRGKIVNLNVHGAFAELEKGITGLIYKSELRDSWIEKPGGIVSLGKELDMKVMKFDPEKKQIQLSLKAVSMEKFIENNKVGSVVRGKITTLTEFGAFAELPEGIEGLIPNSELADRWIEGPEEVVSIGEELDLKVIKVEAEKSQIALSLKAVIKKSRRKPLPRNRRGKKKPATLLETRFKEARRSKNTNKSGT